MNAANGERNLVRGDLRTIDSLEADVDGDADGSSRRELNPQEGAESPMDDR